MTVFCLHFAFVCFLYYDHITNCNHMCMFVFVLLVRTIPFHSIELCFNHSMHLLIEHYHIVSHFIHFKINDIFNVSTNHGVHTFTHFCIWYRVQQQASALIIWVFQSIDFTFWFSMHYDTFMHARTHDINIKIWNMRWDSVL